MSSGLEQVKQGSGRQAVSKMKHGVIEKLSTERPRTKVNDALTLLDSGEEEVP